MDADLARKEEAKWHEGGGVELQAEVRSWIEACLGQRLQGDLQQALKDGTKLCSLANAVKADCCRRPSKQFYYTPPFKQMENISNYLKACESLGLRKEDSFQTVALCENKDMLAVLRQIHQLGAAAQKTGFDGPPLGAKLADANAREFSAEQRQQGAAATTFLGKGSHGHASQAGMFDTSKNIVKSNRVAASTAELSMMGQGSAGCASAAGTGRFKEIVRVQ